MDSTYTILYIHGMGGGGDSRIPSILKETLLSEGIDVVCRTYSFDPEVAQPHIQSWVSELRPDLVIGESLGALHALRIPDVPKLLVAPALNAPLYFELLSCFIWIPGMTWLFDRIYRPREGDRQKIHFTFGVLKKYMKHRSAALSYDVDCGKDGICHAFFGTHDHYRRSGIVSIRTWEKYFGKTYDLYDGTHFMEDECVIDKLYPKIINILKNK